MSQAELAARLGSNQAYISKIETGAANPTLSTCVQIADAVGCSLVIGLGTERLRLAEAADPAALLDSFLATLHKAIRILADAASDIEGKRQTLADSQNMS